MQIYGFKTRDNLKNVQTHVASSIIITARKDLVQSLLQNWAVQSPYFSDVEVPSK
jgi:hypothetical protein